MGTIHLVKCGKYQEILNFAINKEHKNELKTVRINTKKVLYSVNHDYLIGCINL